ncbi:MAG: aminotransferase class III-fold pyridoxal phosphate-dependent enzyme [bacterium]|nr:aminotransferase class III-fold pyridoxal phosphate-dependent enzyme [bacterium]
MDSGRSAVFYRSPGDDYTLFVRAEGCRLWDATGHELVDLTSGVSGAAIIGQGREDIAEAMVEQVRRLSYMHTVAGTTLPQEQLAQRLADLAPEGINRVMFSSGGSEANEIALRIARQYHLARGDASRWKVVGLAPSYHGATAGALSMTGRWDINRSYQPYLFRTGKVPAPVTYRGQYRGLASEEVARRAADALDAAIESEGPHSVSAFIAEPIALSTGMAVPPDEYWPLVREVCDRHGVLFIADEVITGMWRTGRFLALDHTGAVADMTTMAKGLGAGYAPLGATLISEAVADTIAAEQRRMAEVHTYSGSAQSCAVGLAVLDAIESEGLAEQAGKKGDLLSDLLADLIEDLRWVGDVRGRGLLRGIELVEERTERIPLPPEVEVTRLLPEAMWQRGFLARAIHHGSALVGDVMSVNPALTIDIEDLERGVAALRASVLELGPNRVAR